MHHYKSYISSFKCVSCKTRQVLYFASKLSLYHLSVHCKNLEKEKKKTLEKALKKENRQEKHDIFTH